MVFQVGVCGTGIFATDSHLPAFKQSGIKVVAAYNRTKAKAEKFASTAGGATVYDSVEELLKDPNVHALDTLVPVQSNLSIVAQAISANKPIAFEKPIAADLLDGEKIVKLARDSDVPIMVLENWVYHEGTLKLKKLLPEIGKPVTFLYQHTGGFVQNKFHSTTWRQTPQHVGGYLSDAGVHEIALLTEVLGEVKSVCANTTQLREISGDADVVSSLLQLESGAFGTYTYSKSLGAAEPQLLFQIFGTNGSLVLVEKPSLSGPQVTLRLGSDGSSGNEQVFELPPDEIDGLVAEFENFKEAVEKNDKTLIKATPEKAFHHYATIVAMIESSKKGGDKVNVRKV